jgi:hypothetical protein
MDYLLMLHALVRWAIVAVSVIVIVKFAVGWRGGAFAKMDQGLQSGFSGLMDLQMLLGLIFFFWSGLTGGGWPTYRIEHIITMTLAVVVAHLPAMWKKQPDPIRFRNGLFAVLASLALIFAGIAVLPQGWFG